MGSNILETVREAYGRIVYTHKTHEKEADRLARHTDLIKMGELVLIVLTTGSTINVLLGSDGKSEVAAAIFAALALLVSIYQFRFNPEQLIQAHRATAKKLWLIREKYIGLINDLIDGTVTDSDGRQRRDALIQELYSVYENAPPTGSSAYNAASKALKESEEMTFSDEEIDKFLPVGLRKNPHPAPVDSPTGS